MTVTLRKESSIGVLTLERPDVFNCLNPDLLVTLRRLIAANAPLALAQAKFAIDCGLEVNLASGLQIESNAYQLLIPTRDRLEGQEAFQQKRKPVYRGE